MDAVSGEILFELDPAKKDFEWAKKAVSNIRMYWKPYVNIELLRENKDFLLGKNSMEKVKAQFKDKEFLETTEFRNPGLLDSILNTLMEELTKDPPKPELTSVDPAAISLREKDLGLLKNRSIIQGDIGQIQKQIGDPSGYKISNDNFKSNIADFDTWGLDEKDPDDIRFFQDYHVLDADIAGSVLISKLMELNSFDSEILRKLIIDILAIRKICIQVYVDKTTGQIKYKYIYPDTGRGLFGDSFDGHDDTAKGWEENITMSEWLQMVGNDFQFERDWKMLLNSINTTNNLKYTGFNRAGRIYNCFGNTEMLAEAGLGVGVSDNIIGWNDCFRFKVSCGYIEWSTWEATSTNLIKKDTDEVLKEVPFSYDLGEGKENTAYQKESHYQQQWYGSYFLSTGHNTQLLFNFSKVYYQQLYGANDEYSTGSTIFYRENGNPAVSMVKTDIELILSATFKMLFLIYKTKPQDEEYVWEELIQQSKIFKQAFPDGKGAGSDNTVDGIIGQIIAYQRANTVKIRSFPQVNGQTVGQIPQLGQKNHIDPVTAMMQSIMQWGEARLATKMLGNSMRLGDNPQSRESLRSEQNSVDASKNSTGYFYRMLQYTKEKAATISLLYAQDIIKFKDTIPYNFIKTLIGDERFKGLSLLDDFAAHRYGKVFRDYNTTLAKADLRQGALAALTQKQITYPQFVIVTQTEDFREGAKKLGLWQYKYDKKVRSQMVQDQQMQMQLSQQNFQQQMALMKFERDTIMLKQQSENQGMIAGKQIDAQSKVQVKGMTIDSEPAKQDAKSQAKQDELVTKANLENSKPYGD